MKSLILRLIIFVLFLLFTSLGTVFASGTYTASYYHTPEDLNTVSYLQYGNDIDVLDNPNQIVLEGLNMDQLFPLYRRLISKPLTNEVKKKLYYVEPNNNQYNNQYENYVSTIDKWQKERAVYVTSPVSLTNDSVNCSDNTYRNSIDTLNRINETYSEENIVEWIKNEDAVLSECNIDWRKYSEGKLLAVIAHINSGSLGQDVSIDSTIVHKSIFKKIRDFFVNLFNKIFNRNEYLPDFHKPSTCVDCTFDKKYDGDIQYKYEFQQAQKAFYSTKFEKAEKLFKIISNDENHPYAMQATYMLARLYITEERTLPVPDDTNDYTKVKEIFLSKAEAQFNKVITNPNWKELQDDAKDMLKYVNTRRDKFIGLEANAKILENSDNPIELQKALDDYHYIYEVYFNSQDNENLLKNASDFSTWMYIWRHPKNVDMIVMKQKFQATQNDAWLLASVKYTPYADDSFFLIERAVLNLPKSSIAYYTANYYLIKKVIDSGDNAKAQTLINNLDISNASIGVLDFINDLKMRNASTLEEMFKYSERHTYETAGVYINNAQENAINSIAFMDNKAKEIFRLRLPVSKQVELLSRDDIFSKKQTEYLRLVVFLRATLLNDWNSADIIANQISLNNAGIKNDLSLYLSAKNNIDKQYYAAYFIASYPGISLYIYDDVLITHAIDDMIKITDEKYYPALYPRENYKEMINMGGYRWNYCLNRNLNEIPNNLNPQDYYIEILKKQIDPGYYDISIVDKLLSDIDKNTLYDEMKKIYNQDDNYISKVIIDYAGTNPNESSLPEALYFVVKISRYGNCVNNDTSSYSKKAFQLLHTKYPNSEWSKKTPYYF